MERKTRISHTTASVALKRLASCTAKNRFYRANRDLGRVFKTEFLLGYAPSDAGGSCEEWGSDRWRSH